MESDAQFGYWGLLIAALMYVIGNGMWINHMARRRQWLGWVMWSISAVILVVATAAIEAYLSASGGSMADGLTGVDFENHWIAVSLYALMSVPGAASVIFKQDAQWTRLALLITAIIVFIPAGMSLGNEGGNIVAGLGLTLGVCTFVVAWQFLLDKVETA